LKRVFARFTQRPTMRTVSKQRVKLNLPCVNKH